MLPKMAIGEGAAHLKMSCADENSLLERIIGYYWGLVQNYFENVSCRKCGFEEFHLDLRNPIVNNDVTKVDRAYRDSGKAKYSLTEMLFVEEFEKMEELDWISKKKICDGRLS